MSRSKLMIVEGPQGVGKTTVTDYIRNRLSYTNLYRLCGTSDTSVTGKQKSKEMYLHLNQYIKGLENLSINLLFDRLFFTEEVYCRLGKKDYSFTDVYKYLCESLFSMDFDIYYINLYLSNTDLYKDRLYRPGKALFKNSEFNIDNSIEQQNIYGDISNEICMQYPKVNCVDIDMCMDLYNIHYRLDLLLGIEG